MKTEGGKVVSPTHQPYLPPGNIPGTHFCLMLSRLQSHSAAGRIISMQNSNDTFGNRTHDLLACSAVHQPASPPRVPTCCSRIIKLMKYFLILIFRRVLYVVCFFWVFPRRLSFKSRRFGTLYRFHLHRQVKEE